jgi:hypothetical protein
VINLAGGQRHYINPDGTFNLELWKRQIDQYRDVDFAPYVTEGLVLAHFLVDEPLWPGTWGGRAISMEEIEEMAHYSKSLWPSLPTAVAAFAPAFSEVLTGTIWTSHGLNGQGRCTAVAPGAPPRSSGTKTWRMPKRSGLG